MGEITEALRQVRRERRREAASIPATGGSPEEHARRRRGSASASTPPGLGSRDPDRKARGARASAQVEEGAEGVHATLRRFVRVVHRRRIVVASVFAMILGCVTAATFLMTPIYESTATLLVKLEPESVGGPKAGGLRESPIPQAINAEIAILRTHEVIKGVVTSLGATVLYPDLGNSDQGSAAIDAMSPEPPEVKPVQPSSVSLATDRFADNLRVEAVGVQLSWERRGGVIRVSFQHPDPEIAAEAVNLLVDRYKERHVSAFAEARAAAFPKGEVAIKAQMVSYDRELAAIPTLRKQNPNLPREDARVSGEMGRQKIANITILQAGSVPASPIRPRKLLNIAVGAVVAGALGVLAALLMEARQPLTESPESP